MEGVAVGVALDDASDVDPPHATRTRAITMNSPMKEGSKRCLLDALYTLFFMLLLPF